MGKAAIKQRETDVIPVKRKRNRKKTKPPTYPLSVRVLAEVFEYKTQDELRVMVQNSVNKLVLKYQAEGKPKLTKK